jgi:copper(I)-binding protein
MKRQPSHVAQVRQHVAALSSVMVMAMAGLASGAVSGTVSVAFAADEKPAKAVLVKVDDAWVRATVKGQAASGGFMSLTASQDLTLVGFTTPAAGGTELHEMVMDGSIMRMRAIDSLPLPAGRQVTLKPGAGGQHLMLMGLKQPLLDGKEIALTLTLRTAAGKLVKQSIKVPVRAGLQASSKPQPGNNGAGAASAAHPHHGHDHPR